MSAQLTSSGDDPEACSSLDEQWKEATLMSTGESHTRNLSWKRPMDAIRLIHARARRSLVLLPVLTRAVPSYVPISSESPSTTAAPAPASSRTISYDALRGLACVVVFNFHFLYPYTNTTIHGFGDDTGKYIHQLPILCLVVRGHAMVTMFFAISGYVLSSGFLAAVRNDQTEKATSRLSSLALRRWARLFLPASISMFFVAIAAALGAFDNAGRDFEGTPWMTGTGEEHPRRAETFGAQLVDYWRMWSDWTNPWVTRLYWSEYDPHTWTIPVEFRGSMVLFLLLLASAGLRRSWQTCLLIAMAIYSFSTQRWEYGTFIGGAVVADLHQTWPPSPKLSSTLTATHIHPPSRRRHHLHTLFNYSALLLALYILSYPDRLASSTSGFVFLSHLTPPLPPKESDYFWHAIGSFILLFSIERIPLLRRALSARVPQYFGRISYSLYLVHGPLLHSLGFNLQGWIFGWLGTETMGTWLVGLAIGWVIMLGVCVGVAHWFSRFVDEPLVRGTRWVERWVCKGAGGR